MRTFLPLGTLMPRALRQAVDIKTGHWVSTGLELRSPTSKSRSQGKRADVYQSGLSLVRALGAKLAEQVEAVYTVLWRSRSCSQRAAVHLSELFLDEYGWMRKSGGQRTLLPSTEGKVRDKVGNFLRVIQIKFRQVGTAGPSLVGGDGDDMGVV